MHDTVFLQAPIYPIKLENTGYCPPRLSHGSQHTLRDSPSADSSLASPPHSRGHGSEQQCRCGMETQEANPSAPGSSPRANWSPRPVLVGTPLPKGSQRDRREGLRMLSRRRTPCRQHRVSPGALRCALGGAQYGDWRFPQHPRGHTGLPAQELAVGGPHTSAKDGEGRRRRGLGEGNPL